MVDESGINKYAILTGEGDWQPGSNGLVLKNHLDIINVDDMDEAETTLLLKLYEHLFTGAEWPVAVSFDLVAFWHRMWLKPIYGWAGQLRTVNMSKDNFLFAAANFLPQNINVFEQDYLSCYPCLDTFSAGELVSFLAKSHVEFIFIHPFREGNGRISRLLMDVFATQAGMGPLDYSLWDQHKEYYIKAIQAGVNGDLQYMERLVRDVLDGADK